MVKFTQNTDDYYFNVDRITTDHIGRIAKAYHLNHSKNLDKLFNYNFLIDF